MILRFFASTPKGTEALLARELTALGATKIRVQSAGVAFAGTLETGYRACLWSRVVSRVILQLGHFPASDPEALYDGVRAIAWHEHFGLDNTFAVDLNSADSFLTHSHFGARSKMRSSTNSAIFSDRGRRSLWTGPIYESTFTCLKTRHGGD